MSKLGEYLNEDDELRHVMSKAAKIIEKDSTLSSLLNVMPHALDLLAIDRLLTQTDLNYEEITVFNSYLWAICMTRGTNILTNLFAKGKKFDSLLDPFIFSGPHLTDKNRILKRMIIPEGSSQLLPSMFYNCVALESIELPDSLKKLGKDVFYNCKKLTSITLPSNIHVIPPYCFYGSGIQKIVIPKNIATVGSFALAFQISSNSSTEILFEDIDEINFQKGTHGSIFGTNFNNYDDSNLPKLCDSTGKEIIVHDSRGRGHTLNSIDIDNGFFNKGIYKG